MEEGHHFSVRPGARRVRQRKIALELRGSEHGNGGLRLQLDQPLSLVSKKEKHPVLSFEQVRNCDWPSHCSSELVPLQHFPGKPLLVSKELIGIECVVARKLEEAAVELIPSGLSHNADDAACVTAVLRRVIAGQDPGWGSAPPDCSEGCCSRLRPKGT